MVRGYGSGSTYHAYAYHFLVIFTSRFNDGLYVVFRTYVRGQGRVKNGSFLESVSVNDSLETTREVDRVANGPRVALKGGFLFI